MKLGLKREDFSEKQLQILQILLDKEYKQNEIQESLKTSAPNLHYHLSRLEELDLIKKKTLFEIGNAKINQISLNPAARQQVRNILGFEVKNFTILTGFGDKDTGYRVPDLVLNILKKYKFKIDKIVCYTTPEAKKKREEFQQKENLIEINKYIIFPYKDYRYLDSDFFQTVELILSEEQKESNVIVDLTPLSKLFSFKLLELANKYRIPCIYLGMDKNGQDKLYSMSEVRLEGEIKNLV